MIAPSPGIVARLRREGTAEAADHIEWLEATLVQIGFLNALGPHMNPEIDRVIREAAREIAGAEGPPDLMVREFPR